MLTGQHPHAQGGFLITNVICQHIQLNECKTSLIVIGIFLQKLVFVYSALNISFGKQNVYIDAELWSVYILI